MRYTISFVAAMMFGALSARAEVPRVVADFAPVHALVAQVMGTLGTPELLLDRGGDPHDYQLRPSQAAAVQDAALVVWVGPDMTPWLQHALESLGDAAPSLPLTEVAGTMIAGFDGAEAAHDHDHGGIDPHLWLEPTNAVLWLHAIAARLAEIDPDNAATYAANATAAAMAVQKTDAELAAMLAPVRGKPFVVYHDAYGYFARHYGLTVAGSIALGDAVAPGAARLADLRHALEQQGAVCLFPEAGHDPKLGAQLVEGTAVRLGGALDPEGVGLEPGAGLYDALLRGLAGTLVDCLAKG